jgi:hypothetical protein
MFILTQFPDKAMEDLALKLLIPRFPGKSWDTGETLIPPSALEFLAEQRVRFSVIGPAPRTLNSPFP